MKTETYDIINQMGLHARPASEIAKLVGTHKSKVTFTCGAKSANAKSMLLITTLGAKKGTSVTVTVEGEDEEEVFATLDEMFANHFGED